MFIHCEQLKYHDTKNWIKNASLTTYFDLYVSDIICVNIPNHLDYDSLWEK